MILKILNLYAGIGGNRKLWDGDIEVTAVEIKPQIAKIYSDFFPRDKMVVGDAHQFLLEHFKEYDFIWSSPPCPSHSRLNNLNNNKGEQGQEPKYPDMRLYEEIILLTHWFKGKWCVENVVSYYVPLIKPFKRDSHYFWSNFYLGNSKNNKRYIREHICDGIPNHGFEFEAKSSFKEQLLNNCVKPETGLSIFNCAFKVKQQVLIPSPSAGKVK
jgi:DNA (cytosine-5)-methyltransferase 1